MSEKLKILEMLDQGTITVEEANQLPEVAHSDIVVDIDDADDRVQVYIG